MTAPDLASWLLEQIAAEESTARNASPAPWTYDRETFTVRSGQWEVASRRRSTYPGDPRSATTPMLDVDAAHIARHDPARVLADCAAKRAIVEAWPRAREAAQRGQDSVSSANVYRDTGYVEGLEQAVRLLALPYADADGYRGEWRP